MKATMLSHWDPGTGHVMYAYKITRANGFVSIGTAHTDPYGARLIGILHARASYRS